MMATATTTTPWTRCTIPNNTTYPHTIDNTNKRYYTIYGPAELETYHHARLRQSVKAAKLQVYYPGRWGHPSPCALFRVSLRTSGECGSIEGCEDRQWKFLSNARIVSVKSEFEILNEGIYWGSTHQIIRNEIVYDHCIHFSLVTDCITSEQESEFTLVLELDTRPVDSKDGHLQHASTGQCSSALNDEEIHIHPPPCICLNFSNDSSGRKSSGFELESCQWKPVPKCNDPDMQKFNHKWSQIYQCWTSDCPFEKVTCQLKCDEQHNFDAKETIWVFPHQMSMCHADTVQSKCIANQEGSLLYDFGKELFGKIKIILTFSEEPFDLKKDIPLKLCVGETIAEAMKDNEEYFEQSTELTCVNHGNVLGFTSVHLLAFRYAQIIIDDNISYEVKLECVSTSPRVEMKGSFSTCLETIDNSTGAEGACHVDNKIWQAAMYTLQNCIHHNFIVDGIKRDRLPWAGDLAVSIMANSYTVMDMESIRCTLAVLGRCGMDRLLQLDAALGDTEDEMGTRFVRESHVNGIVDFSLWYVISHWLYQRYFGDLAFLLQEWDNVRVRLQALFKHCADGDNGFLLTADDDWVFIDWSESVQKDTALQILWWWALECGVLLAELLQEDSHVSDSCTEDFSKQLRGIQTQLQSSFVDKEDIQDSYSRHAHILGVLSGLNIRLVDTASSGDWWDPDTSDDHWQRMIKARKLDNLSLHILLGDEIDCVGTPFMKHLECLAISRLGNRSRALKTVRRYWGGMLSTGATTFYEAFDEKENPNDIAAFYGRPFARSLCHAWGSGPCALLPEILLGLRPLSNEWEVFICDPIEDCPPIISCCVQTKHGAIQLSLDPSTLNVVVPNGTSMKLMEKTYGPGNHSIDRSKLLSTEAVRQWSQKYRNWLHHPSHIIPHNPEIPGYEGITMTDVPTVFQLPGDTNYYMSFVGFDGISYRSFVAESTDLIHWTGFRLAMANNEGIDEGGVVLGAYLYESYDIDAPRVLKQINGRYYSLYGAYSKKGGYEIDPGHQGLASSKDGLFWVREKNEILTTSGPGIVKDWEKASIYQPWLVEQNGAYLNFYNAKQMPQWVEQIGLASSKDLFDWERNDDNPIFSVSSRGWDTQFCADAKIFYDSAVNHWVMFYFGVGKGGAHIMIAFSKDLLHWIRDPVPLYHSGDNPSGLDKSYAHKVSIVCLNNVYYLFYCAVGDKGRGIGLIMSQCLTG